MLKIHPKARRLIVTDEGKDVQIGWRIETRDFVFDAIKHEEDNSVNVYVLWGDDQGGDMSSHADMSEAKAWLDTLLKATYPEDYAIKSDILEVLNTSVDEGLTKAGYPNTPHNRVEVLNNIYARITSVGIDAKTDHLLLRAIETEIIRLQEEL